MADSVTMQITGLQDLNRMLTGLPQSLQTRVLRGMTATGASVIRKEAILRAPVYTGEVSQGHPPPGTLKKAIFQYRLSRECTPTRETFIVDVRKGKTIGKKGRINANDAFYANWVERGTAKMAAKPFMRPAFETKKQAAVEAMRAYLIERLPDAVAGARIAGR